MHLFPNFKNQSRIITDQTSEKPESEKRNENCNLYIWMINVVEVANTLQKWLTNWSENKNLVKKRKYYT